MPKNLLSILSQEEESNLDEETKIKSEIMGYIINARHDENESPIQFRGRSNSFYRCLAKAALFVFTFPAYSTGPERIFSITDMIRSKHRSGLTPQTTETMAKVGSHIRELL